MVAENCRSRCLEQGIQFYRFSPELQEVIASGETDSDKLVDMILAARMHTKESIDFHKMIHHFHELAHASREMHHKVLPASSPHV